MGTSPHPKSRKIWTLTHPHLITACLLAHFTLRLASNESNGESRASRNKRVQRGREAGEGGRAPTRFFVKLARTQNNKGRGSEQVAGFPSRASQERHGALSTEAEGAFLSCSRQELAVWLGATQFAS